jgi:exodeoxyribonuclease VIII
MPEIISDLSNEDYHQHKAIGASGLKLIGQTPLHYWARYLDPNRERDAPTAAMKRGTAVHCALLEPEEFDRRYVVVPEGIDRRSNAGKQLFAEIEASGKEPLKPDQMAEIRAMQAACRSHPVSRILFSHPLRKFETTLFWDDLATGARCKMRPDYHLPPCDQFPNGLLMDPKTCPDASPAEFARSAWNMEMPIQAAWYTDGFMAHYGTTEPPPFIWLAAEANEPYPCAYYSAGAEIVEYGRSEYRRLLSLYMECVATNTWPGYSTAIQSLELPPWAQRIIESNDSQDIEEISYVAQ